MLGSLFPVQSSVAKVGFEDVKEAIKHPANTLLINTLPITEQAVLIPTTIPYDKEESTVNAMLTSYDTSTYTVIVYGKHSVDDTPEKKHRQLKQAQAEVGHGGQHGAAGTADQGGEQQARHLQVDRQADHLQAIASAGPGETGLHQAARQD
jgi:hypothetical protein